MEAIHSWIFHGKVFVRSTFPIVLCLHVSQQNLNLNIFKVNIRRLHMADDVSRCISYRYNQHNSDIYLLERIPHGSNLHLL